MDLTNTVKWSFIIGMVASISGALLKIMHTPNAATILGIGIIATLIFVVSAIYEVFSSKRIDHPEKIMWSMAFIFFSTIAGIIYFFIGRKRVVAGYSGL